MFGSVRREVAFLLIIIFLLSGIFYLMLINFWFGIGIYHVYLYPVGISALRFATRQYSADEVRGGVCISAVDFDENMMVFHLGQTRFKIFFIILKLRLINSLQRGRWKWLEFGYLSTWLIIKQDDRVINKNWKGQRY